MAAAKRYDSDQLRRCQMLQAIEVLKARNEAVTAESIAIEVGCSEDEVAADPSMFSAIKRAYNPNANPPKEHGLVRAAYEKRNQTLDRAWQTVAEFESRGERPTVDQFVQAARVSKAWLYLPKNQDLMDAVNRLRAKPELKNDFCDRTIVYHFSQHFSLLVQWHCSNYEELEALIETNNLERKHYSLSFLFDICSIQSIKPPDTASELLGGLVLLANDIGDWLAENSGSDSDADAEAKAQAEDIWSVIDLFLKLKVEQDVDWAVRLSFNP
ncbi:MAG TPA: hypothetical protein V6D29_13730 [Leptolyngbyaceae cyanobacterium]